MVATLNGEHSIMYKKVESLCCTSEIKVTIGINCTKKKSKYKCVHGLKDFIL